MEDKIWYKGAAILTFTPTDGDPIIINKTLKDNDTKLVYATEVYEQFSDQQAAPEVEMLSGQSLKITCGTPVEYESLVGLTPEWTKGTTGFALKDSIGIKSIMGTLSVLPKGATAGTAGEYLLGSVKAKVDMEENFKVDGKIFSTLEFTASPDEDGNLMTTGDWTKA